MRNCATLTGNDELTPSVDQYRITSLRLDSLWVFYRLPRQLRECPPLHQGTPLLLPEPVLLTVGGVPDPIHEDIGNIKCHESEAIPAVYRRCVVGQVDSTVTVAQGYASQIPKDEHKSPFLVIHVPITR